MNILFAASEAVNHGTSWEDVALGTVITIGTCFIFWVINR